MFTGIIEHQAPVISLRKQRTFATLTIASPFTGNKVELGASIAINGVCLTVSEMSGDALSFHIQNETLNRTYLGELKPGTNINVERALALGGRLGGHLVQGHVDEVGRIHSNERKGDNDWILAVSASDSFLSQLIQKGSVAIDGISLTVVGKKSGFFTVHIVPHTLYTTALRDKQPNDPVNLESDMIGKYVYNYLSQTAGTNPDASLMRTLQEGGFIS